MVNPKKMCYSCPAEEGYLTLDFDNEINPDIYGLNNHTYLIIGGEYPIDMWSSSIVSASINPHAPDRFNPSRARCAENCGSALTYH